MKTMEDGDIFNFVIGGTAHCRNLVAATMDSNRDESFTTESTCFFWNTRSSILQRIQNNLKKNSVPYECKHNEVSFIQQGYSFTILHTPNLHADIPSKLNLPLSI